MTTRFIAPVARAAAADWGPTLHVWAQSVTAVLVAVYVAGWAARQALARSGSTVPPEPEALLLTAAPEGAVPPEGAIVDQATFRRARRAVRSQGFASR